VLIINTFWFIIIQSFIISIISIVVRALVCAAVVEFFFNLSEPYVPFSILENIDITIVRIIQLIIIVKFIQGIFFISIFSFRKKGSRGRRKKGRSGFRCLVSFSSSTSSTSSTCFIGRSNTISSSFIGII
jgi:hypothetical protein